MACSSHVATRVVYFCWLKAAEFFFLFSTCLLVPPDQADNIAMFQWRENHVNHRISWIVTNFYLHFFMPLINTEYRSYANFLKISTRIINARQSELRIQRVATTLNIKLLETGFNFDKKYSFRILRRALNDVIRWKKRSSTWDAKMRHNICFVLHHVVWICLALSHTTRLCLCCDSIFMKWKWQIEVFRSVEPKLWSRMKIFQQVYYRILSWNCLTRMNV